MRRALLLLIITLVSTVPPLWGAGGYTLPDLPPPHEYGSFLMDRTVTVKGAKPVIFSHWLHRAEASCRICHGELEFDMIVGSTPVSEADNREGRFCGACHNGEFAFSVQEEGNCPRCHRGELSSEKDKFTEFRKKGFPPTEFGDGIDWGKAIKRQIITPAGYIYTPGSAMISSKVVTFEAKIRGVTAAIFPHAPHGDWMDCSMCHPDLFPLDGKGLAKMTKPAILKGEYCGLCHLRVAFPMNDCPRCHPGMSSNPR